MIKPSDSKHLSHFFPDTDWEEHSWEFFCFSRQEYANRVPLNAEDEITLGIYYSSGGAICELSINWNKLEGELVPQLTIFADAWCLLKTPTFQSVVSQLIKLDKSAATPDKVSAMLIALGFADQSDRPLDGTAPAEK